MVCGLGEEKLLTSRVHLPGFSHPSSLFGLDPLFNWLQRSNKTLQ